MMPSHPIDRRQDPGRTRKFFVRLTGGMLTGVLLLQPAAAAIEDFTSLSLEELMKVELTTAAKTPQTLMRTAAAAFVITQDDIRRSGATNIPQLLRMAPGIDVAQVSADTYAISARGFNGVYATKLLVLIDGRSVYTPLFSGVQWDLQDTMLEDIERIEVIRGPGGTLWGANAFSGVINIITKSAAETQGGLATAHGGNLKDGGAIRYGGQIDASSFYRIWGKYDHHENDVKPSGVSANDHYDFGRSGFRYDAAPAPDLRVMVEGGATRGDEGQIFQRLRPAFPFASFLQPSTTTVSAGHLLGRATKSLGAGEQWQFQSYLDWTDRTVSIYREKRLTADLEAQHTSVPFEGHKLIWGLGYRATTDWTQGTFDIAFNPSRATEHLANLFVQDEIALVPDTLSLILGSKFEYTSWGGFDVQPNVRLIWNPTPQQAVWASVSRAVRTPSRAERDLRFNFNVLRPPFAAFPTLVTVLGNTGVVSEKIIAFETGYRWNPTPRVNLDIAGFYNLYTDLTTVNSLRPRLVGGLPNLPVQFNNSASGHAYGVELATGWQATDWLTFRSAYTYQLTQLTRSAAGVTDTTSIAYQNSIPRNKVYSRASFNLSPTVALDLQARYVGKLNLSAANTTLVTLPNVNSYVALDLRLGWHVTDRLLVELIGQNLNRSQHVEFQDFGPTRAAAAEIGRAALARVTVLF
jgi:iron complex outermembrane receptor protein